MRTLPDSLTSGVRNARRIETIARLNSGLRGWHRAIQATNVLLLAAAESGWTHDELGAVLGLKRQAVTARVDVARRACTQPRSSTCHWTGRSTRGRSRLPVADREWVVQAEAAALASVSMSTIRN